MKAFARLLESLVMTPSRNAKLTLLTDYFRTQPDPDRGWALACIAGSLELRNVTGSTLRTMAEDRVDPVLFRLSYDYVGDLAETVALIWPAPEEPPDGEPLRLSRVVETLASATRPEAIKHLAGWMDRLAPSERLGLLKLATGGLRVGVSERLAKTALAAVHGGEDTLDRIEEMWHGMEPPYVPLMQWLDGSGPPPQVDLTHAFRPMMLAHPLDNTLYSVEERRERLHEAPEAETLTVERLNERLDPAAHSAEWKWDGIRIQAVSLGGERRLYTRMGEEIGHSFPDVIDAMAFEGVADGELLVMRAGQVAPFFDLQKRLGRKSPGAKTLRESPGHIRLYDLLHDGAEDVRPLPFAERRARLEAWFAEQPIVGGVDLSPVIPFATWAELAAVRDTARADEQEGLMLKRLDSA